jgi:predicted aspartyl protease
LGAGAATRAAGSGHEWTPFELGAHREPLVPVYVNDAGPFLFVLDTGSSHTSISDRLAEALGTPAVAQAPVGTSLGVEMQRVVRLGRLVVGGVASDDVLASIVDGGWLDAAGRIQGVLGQDVLSVRRYTIDFRSGRILWSCTPIAATDGALTLPLRESDGRFVLALPQDEGTLALVPDSGAEGFILYGRRDRRLPKHTTTGRRFVMSTVARDASAREIDVRELRIGSATLRNVPAVLVEPPDSAPVTADGLLPLHWFDRVAIDGPGRSITLSIRAGDRG